MQAKQKTAKAKPKAKAKTATKSAAKAKIKTKNMRQTVAFKAGPADAYETIMDQKKHTALTGSPAKVSRKVGGAHSAHGGYCWGENLELVDGRKIVQTWRAQDWPKDHFSTITYAFAKTPAGCKLTFTQSGIPEKELEHMKSGWKEFYWQPMKEKLGG
jgi:activator of HSP90 ATPase